MQRYIFYRFFCGRRIINKENDLILRVNYDAMEEEIKKCAQMLLEGKVILYPTDTVWGIGCDATNDEAIDRIYSIKQRQESKSMIILLDRMERIPYYISRVPLIAWDLMEHIDRPTTCIYPNARNLSSKAMAADQSIAIRIVRNSFCRKLIKAIDRPLVSTSANLSGQPAAATFHEISPEIIKQMDYVVPEKYAVSTDYKPSRIIRFMDDYNFVIVRE